MKKFTIMILTYEALTEFLINYSWKQEYCAAIKRFLFETPRGIELRYAIISEDHIKVFDYSSSPELMADELKLMREIDDAIIDTWGFTLKPQSISFDINRISIDCGRYPLRQPIPK